MITAGNALNDLNVRLVAKRLLDRFLVRWMALFYVLFPVSVFLNPSSGGTSNFFYLGVLLPWLGLVLRGCLRNISPSPLIMSTLILFAYLWVTTLWGGHNTAYDLTYLALRVVFAACMITAPLIIVKSYPDLFSGLLPIIFFSSVLCTVLVIAFHLGASDWQWFAERLHGVGYGFNPIGLAIHCGAGLLVSFHLMVSHSRWRWLIGLLAFLPLLAMLMTQSRGPIAFFIVAAECYLLLYVRHKEIFIFKLLLLLVIGAALVGIGSDSLLERGWSYRPEIWLQTIRLVQDSLWFGEGYSLDAQEIGFSEGKAVTHSHNFLLEIFRYGGVFGALLCCWQLWRILLLCWESHGSEYFIYSVLFGFGLLCMAINGWYLLDRPNYFWLTYWYPLGALLVLESRKNNQSTLLRS